MERSDVVCIQAVQLDKAIKQPVLLCFELSLVTRKVCMRHIFTGSVYIFIECHSYFVSIKRTASVQLPCKLLYGIALLGCNVNISACDHLLRLPKYLACYGWCGSRDASEAQFS